MANKILNKILKGKNGNLRILSIALFFLLIITVLAAAQSLTKSLDKLDQGLTEKATDIEQSKVEIPQDPGEAESSEEAEGQQAEDSNEIPAENSGLCKDITCQDSSIQCPDGATASCLNTCNSETGECSACKPDCTGHDALPAEELLNESIPQNENISLPADEEVNKANETNETEANSKNPAEPISPEPQEPETSPGSPIDVQLFYPNRITRGQEIELQARITNNGSKTLKNVIAELFLPPELGIISENKIENCGSLSANQTCEVSVKILATLKASLGNNKIKILVRYNE